MPEKQPRGYFDEMGYDPDTFRAEQAAAEKKDRPKQMTKLPSDRARSKLSLRTVIFIAGLILLFISTSFAVLSLSDTDQEQLHETEEYRLFSAVLASDELNSDNGPGSSYFHGGSVMAATGEDLRNDLAGENNDLLDLQFVIEIIDVSGYPVHYTRSLENDNAIATSTLPEDSEGTDIVMFEAGVIVEAGENELHSARFIMYIWK